MIFKSIDWCSKYEFLLVVNVLIQINTLETTPYFAHDLELIVTYKFIDISVFPLTECTIA